jgi:hypothetical protein
LSVCCSSSPHSTFCSGCLKNHPMKTPNPRKPENRWGWYNWKLDAHCLGYYPVNKGV